MQRPFLCNQPKCTGISLIEVTDMENEVDINIGKETGKADKMVQSTKSANKRRILGSLGVRLTVSLIAAVIAAAVRLSSPEVYCKTTSCFSDSVDFISAFHAVSRGVSGEQDMQEALREAYRFAFVGSRQEDKFPVSNVK